MDDDQGEQGSSTWKWVGIGCGILALLGACFAAACLGCSGLAGVGVYAALEAPAEQSKAFLRDLRADAYDSAYARTSATYRASHDVAQFQAAVDAVPALGTMSDDTISNRRVNGSHAEMSGFLVTPEGPVDVRFDLTDAGGGAWTIDGVSVAGEAVLR